MGAQMMLFCTRKSVARADLLKHKSFIYFCDALFCKITFCAPIMQ